MSSYHVTMSRSDNPYHHGALRAALIEATEALLAERGPDAFSLREVARRAGVSPAAPTHHFGDAAGLLTAVATLGFEALAHALDEADAGAGGDAHAALRGQGLAYVRFALDHPGRFRLMFRSGQLHADPLLAQHGAAAFEALARAVRRASGVADATSMREPDWHAVTALWSLVHGYAHLAIAGRFDKLGGADGLEAFVARSLGPIIDATLRGLFPDLLRPTKPPRGGRAARRRSLPAS
jgi:AcrR family transcriptional regulator